MDNPINYYKSIHKCPFQMEVLLRLTWMNLVIFSDLIDHFLIGDQMMLILIVHLQTHSSVDESSFFTSIVDGLTARLCAWLIILRA